MPTIRIANEHFIMQGRAVSSRWLKATLYMATFATNRSMAKAVGAALRNPDRVKKTSVYVGPTQLMTFELGYRVWSTQLPEHATSLVVVAAKLDSLLFGDEVAAVERYLHSPAFDTPLLEDWTPAITKCLRERNLLTACDGFGTPATLCELDRESLDEIVSTELSNSRLII